MRMKEPSTAHKRMQAALEKSMIHLTETMKVPQEEDAMDFKAYQKKQEELRKSGKDDDYYDLEKWKHGVEHHWRDYYRSTDKR
jgi:hypothetical protein